MAWNAGAWQWKIANSKGIGFEKDEHAENAGAIPYLAIGVLSLQVFTLERKSKKRRRVRYDGFRKRLC